MAIDTKVLAQLTDKELSIIGTSLKMASDTYKRFTNTDKQPQLIKDSYATMQKEVDAVRNKLGA